MLIVAKINPHPNTQNSLVRFLWRMQRSNELADALFSKPRCPFIKLKFMAGPLPAGPTLCLATGRNWPQGFLFFPQRGDRLLHRSVDFKRKHFKAVRERTFQSKQKKFRIFLLEYQYGTWKEIIEN